MNLQMAIDEALRLTVDLQEALRSGDLSACSDLLARRGTALESFAACHAGSTPAEKAACATGLDALLQADQSLQQSGAAARDAVGRDWSRNFGKAPSPRHEYDRPPEIACLDRKA